MYFPQKTADRGKARRFEEFGSLQDKAKMDYSKREEFSSSTEGCVWTQQVCLFARDLSFAKDIQGR